MARKTTRSTEPPGLPSAAELRRLKLSPEVAHYLLTRGFPLPECPPAIKTPEPRNVREAAFDGSRVDRVLAAMRKLRHTKGRQFAGKPLVPDPWQVAYILAPVFGWVRKDPGGELVRIINTLYVDLPRRNGKTTTAGGIALYLTTADREDGAEVYALAAAKDQARKTFDPVRQIAQKSPSLGGRVKCLADKIVYLKTASYFQVVSAVADLMHGANVHGAIIDELHVHKSADLVETVETGTGSRLQPLIAIITTADDGKPGTIYARKRRYVEQLAARVITDETAYGVIWCAAESDDPFVEATWKKANPGYGISPTKAYLERAAKKAKNSPADLSSFLRLHLGVRTKQATRYITLPVWDSSAGMVDELALAGRKCHGGLDLASVEDMTALCWTFPGDDEYDVIWRTWLPEARIDALNKRTAGEASVWVREGWLTLTPGNVIDNDFIVAQALKDAETFQVATLGYDRWGATDVVRRLGDQGLTCVPIGQGFASMSAPTKELLRLLLRERYRHGGNPVMRWQVDNLAVRLDPAGNVKPDKEKAADKIDGVAAAVNALKECMDAEAEEEVPLPAAVNRQTAASTGGLWRPQRLNI